MRRNSKLIVGSDINTSVGVNAERTDVSEKYDLGRVNDTGRDLIDMSEQHELHYMGYKAGERGGTSDTRYITVDAKLQEMLQEVVSAYICCNKPLW